MIATKDIYIEQFLLNPNFLVKEDGTIWTKRTTNGAGILPKGIYRPVKIRVNTKGYAYINYTPRKGSRKTRTTIKLSVHRIIFHKFISPLHKNLVINHKNGIKNDNRVDNLELVTPKENIIHSIHILKKSPIRNYKITKEIAELIREDRKSGFTYSELIKKYSLCKSSISYIINHKIWK